MRGSTKMRQILLCAVGFCLFLQGSAQSQNDDYDENEEDHGHHQNHQSRDQPKIVTEFEKKIWNVATNLYKEVKKNEQGNFILSPLSLTTLMVMLNEGAGGETATQIQSTFQFGTNSQFNIRNQTQVLRSLNTTQTKDRASGVEFVSASRIYANNKTANLLQTYVRAVSSLGEVETLDFTDPKPVVMKINEWVKTQTQGKILNIVKDKDFSKDTAAVLLNALYFKAPWKEQFNKSHTKSADFHVTESKKVQVEMMYISADFPYAELTEIGANALFLPYKGERISMIIYLPWTGRNLSTLEAKLETLVPSEVRNQARTSEQSVYFPKFNISSSLDLKAILTSLGVQKIFERDEANFTKMSDAEKFHVSKVRQNVFIDVNEEGTEAAAVTDAFALAATSFTSPIEVNRPFIFQIYDNVTGTVLLSGRIVNPNESAFVKHEEESNPQKPGPKNTVTPKPDPQQGEKSAGNRMNIFVAPFFTCFIYSVFRQSVFSI